MQSEIISLIEEADDGGYTACALDHDIFTESDSLQEVRGMVRDAVACCFGEAERPRVIRLHFVKDELLPA